MAVPSMSSSACGLIGLALLSQVLVSSAYLPQGSLEEDELPQDAFVHLLQQRARATHAEGGRGLGLGSLPQSQSHPPTSRHNEEVLAMWFPFTSLKLGFCSIGKVASMNMMDLSCALEGAPSPGCRMQQSNDDAEVIGIQRSLHWEDFTRENGWKFAAFVRDPVERYISAFGNFCLQYPWGEGAGDEPCCGGRVLQGGDARSKDEAIAWFERRVLSDLQEGGVWDDKHHWQMQSARLRECGRDRFGPDRIDVLSNLDEGTAKVHASVLSMLGPAARENATVAALVDKYFPRDHVAGHGQHNHRRIPVEEYLRNATVVRALDKLFHNEYAELHLPLPSYMRRAHSEEEQSD